jgi:hypothetical protein
MEVLADEATLEPLVQCSLLHYAAETNGSAAHLIGSSTNPGFNWNRVDSIVLKSGSLLLDAEDSRDHYLYIVYPKPRHIGSFMEPREVITFKAR